MTSLSAKPFKTVDRFFSRFLRTEHGAFVFALAPLVVGLLRYQEEALLFGMYKNATDDTVVDVLLFYYLMLAGLVLILRFIGGLDARRAIGPAAMGLILALLPPLIDTPLGVTPAENYQYFRELCWTFAAPYQPVGETVTLWLSVALITIYVGWASRNTKRALASGTAFYLQLVALTGGRIPLEQSLSSFGIVAPGASHLFAIVLIVAAWSALKARTMLPSLARINHALPWGLAAAFGARISGDNWDVVAVKAVLCTVAFLIIVVENDYWDHDLDATAGGTARLADKDDLGFALLVQALLLAFAWAWYANGAMLLLLFFAIWKLYHHPDTRLKRFFCVNYTIEGLSAACCVLIGLLRQEQIVADAPPFELVALALGGFALGSMFKDYKDIKQDRLARVGTIYTLLRRSVPVVRIHRIGH